MLYPSIIGVISPTQIGDCVCSLTAARYIKKVFPHSYSVAALDPRSRELAPLLLNHPDIDKIYITQKEEGYTKIEEKWVSTFDYNLYLFGHLVHEDWAKNMNPRETNFRLRFQFQPPNSPLSVDGWALLTEDEKKPRLEQWFKVARLEKLIAISPFVGYNNHADKIAQTRSPSLDWWKMITEMLLQMGFNVVQLGMSNCPIVYEHERFHDRRGISLLESTKISLGADLFIGACGGMSFIVNAYGQKSICPYTDWIKDATSNALLPVNYKNNLISIFGKEGINSIESEAVRQAVCNQLFL